MDLFDLAIASKLSGDGGGGGGMTLLQTVDCGHLKTSSTSATDTGISADVDVTGYDELVSVSVSNATDTGYHKATIAFTTIYGSNRNSPNRNYALLNGIVFKITSTGYQTASAPQGVWAVINGIADGIATVNVNMRYNSTNTGTIDGDYTLYLYGIDGLSFVK